MYLSLEAILLCHVQPSEAGIAGEKRERSKLERLGDKAEE